MSLIDQINQSSPRAIRVVAFDIGGVLVRINRTWEDALTEAGIRSTVFGALGTYPGIESFQLGAIELDEYLAGLQSFLKLEDAKMALHVHNLILKDPYPGTLELIEELNGQGVITACLSNTNAPHWVEMNAGRFPNITALQVTGVSHEMKLQKPEASIYEAFEILVNALPREIIFFDDLEENVEAACDRGWKAYWIDHARDTAEQMELILVSEGVLSAP
jgi:putative hydrolase of the HAD superfamily